jgi:hypothetical protein
MVTAVPVAIEVLPNGLRWRKVAMAVVFATLTSV